ncbi:MAG: bifunctional folylpolyglutamate synthase/dihydrofolate synthase [Patulibacter sp.]|nr:bifunctional folylpolyglutamate synthase/dihydrofolate synthase [Patulibacter sp.]
MSEIRPPAPPADPSTAAPTTAVASDDAAAAAALAAAEGWLLERELFGIRPGLERMRALLARLGDPQDAFDAIHVVGSNGKSSTVTIAAALLERRGIRAGAYVSPHLVSFRERVLIGGEPADPAAFAAAVTRVRDAALALEREGALDGEVTQFEAVTAAAFVALRAARVACAVIEAGLGGRWDATNVLPTAQPRTRRRPVAVLTSVSLEHTRWLGDTVTAIATEKVEVLRPGGTLVVADGVPAAAVSVAADVTKTRQGRLVRAPAEPDDDVPTPGAPGYQRHNLATAIAAVDAYLGDSVARDAEAERDVAARIAVPGRFETVDPGSDGGPTVIHDGAHNAAGAAALADALAAAEPARPVVLVVGVLDDKDPAEMLTALEPWGDTVVAVAPRNPRAIPAERLAAIAREAFPGRDVRTASDAHAAVDQARAAAGTRGTVVVTGSLHLVADLHRGRQAAPGATF